MVDSLDLLLLNKDVKKDDQKDVLHFITTSTTFSTKCGIKNNQTNSM